jgi:hypothetical protein
MAVHCMQVHHCIDRMECVSEADIGAHVACWLGYNCPDCSYNLGQDVYWRWQCMPGWLVGYVGVWILPVLSELG